MNTITLGTGKGIAQSQVVTLARALVITGGLFCASHALAQMPPNIPTNKPLASWSFSDPTNWTSDQGHSPISFTNLSYSWLGDGQSLVVNTNLPAWLNFPVVEPTGATNLILNGPGSLAFWYAPRWATTNGGPGEWAELLEVGEWTTNAASGYWGLSVDADGSNLWFLAQDNAGDSYGLSTPISWTTNYFHYVALTYSSTNVSLYLDGRLATNDPGSSSVWPGTNAISGGMYFGSDTNGLLQADGLFNSVKTYTYPLSSNDVRKIFNWDYNMYIADPFNLAMANLNSAPSSPSTSPGTPDVITGQGDLLILVSNVTPCVSVSTNQVWLTNVTASVAANGTMGIIFTIEGGLPNVPYDVFANSVLSFGTNGVPWAWMGQGYQCNTYMLTNLPPTTCFLILGTPQSTCGCGLTDAYQLLVSKTDPTNPYSDMDGLLTGWEILLGLNPHVSNFTSPSERSNYGYTSADWLNGVSGIRSGSITNDPEGNVQSVSQ